MTVRCAWCKSAIRPGRLRRLLNALRCRPVSHGLCETCADTLWPDGAAA